MFKFDRRLFTHFDMIFLLLVLLIGTMAIANLYSASQPFQSWGTPPWQKQLVLSLALLCGMAFILCFDYKFLHQINYVFYVAVIVLLLVADLIGSTKGGSQRWIPLGFFNLQPSEFAKLSLMITLASYYARHDRPDGYGLRDILLPGGLLILPFVLILVQPDLGTALMLGIIWVCMTWYVNLKWKTLLILVGAVGLFGAIIACDYLYGTVGFLKPYQKQRIETMFNPEQDAMGSGYQILQSKIAIGSGGWTGNGYGAGPQGHLSFLPERHTDFAFAVLGEEWGFIGTMVFLGIYFAMLLWGLYVAHEAKDRFGALLAFGVVVLIFWQAVINLFMVLGFLPVVGIPLPLVSYGGSSLLTTGAGLAILMNVRMRRFDPNAPH